MKKERTSSIVGGTHQPHPLSLPIHPANKHWYEQTFLTYQQRLTSALMDKNFILIEETEVFIKER